MDENEPASRIEPCRLEQIPEALGDVIADLKAEATQLGNRLAPSTARALASLVRAMNTYYSDLFDLDHLCDRLRLFTVSQGFRPESVGILDEVVIRGEMPRGDASRASGLPERTARDVLGALIASGVLASETPKGPVSLRFPARVAEIVFPRLYAEAA